MKVIQFWYGPNEKGDFPNLQGTCVRCGSTDVELHILNDPSNGVFNLDIACNDCDETQSLLGED